MTSIRRSLDTMVHGVTEEVNEGVTEVVDDAVVHSVLSTGYLETHLLAELSGEIANGTRKTIEERRQRDETQPFDCTLELTHPVLAKEGPLLIVEQHLEHLSVERLES